MNKRYFTRAFALIFLFLSIFLIISLFFFLPKSSSCQAANCTITAVYGRQPYPTELLESFELAGLAKLGSNGPDMPLIWNGYPLSQALQISPYVPCILLEAIGYTESTGWKQFNAGYGSYGYTVISNDCGYGIMQITDPSYVSSRVAGEPAYNIGTGAKILLKEKWNNLQYYVGSNDPHIVEDWYFSVWAYFQGQINWAGNPNNPNYLQNRSSWMCGRDINQVRGNWPYQELVWGCAANPPDDPTNPGTLLWQPVALTLPPNGDLYNGQGALPPTHINRPTPYHSSCSINFMPTIMNNYPPCVSPIIQNGGFESGSSYWNLGGGTSISGIIPHSGLYSAWLGGYPIANDSIYQTVTIPSTGPTGKAVASAWLGYYWYLTTQKTTHPHDYFYVKIRNNSGNDLITLDVRNDGDINNNWNYSSFDVSTYIGQTIQIYFLEINDSNLNTTDFFIDDVAMSACEAK